MAVNVANVSTFSDPWESSLAYNMHLHFHQVVLEEQRCRLCARKYSNPLSDPGHQSQTETTFSEFHIFCGILFSFKDFFPPLQSAPFGALVHTAANAYAAIHIFPP